MDLLEIVNTASSGGVGAIIVMLLYKGGQVLNEIKNINKKINEVSNNQKACERYRCRAESEIQGRITTNATKISRIEGRHNGEKVRE